MKITDTMRNTNRNIWSRRLAFQAIYSWSINPCDIKELEAIFESDENFEKSDCDYFRDIVRGVIDNIDTIDNSIKKKSRIDIKNINMVELSIIRCYVYEIIYNKKIAKQILISEYIKLATKFGGQDSYKFINAFLDNFETIEK